MKSGALCALKTPGEVEAEVLMTKTTHVGSILLVEGDDDFRFWWRLVVKPQCVVINSGGKMNVCGAIERLNSRQTRGVLGIIDADFDPFAGIFINSPNLIVTHLHDLECVLIESDGLEAVLSEFVDKSKLIALEMREQKSFKEALFWRGALFGRLRLASLLRGWEVRFEVCSPWKYVDDQTWIVRGEDLMRDIAILANVDRAEIELGLRNAPSVDDELTLCHGHDLIDLVCIALKSIGRKMAHSVNRVESTLRTGVDLSKLETTPTWQRIVRWEGANPPFRVVTK